MITAVTRAWMGRGMRGNKIPYMLCQAPDRSSANESYPFATDNVEPDDDLDDGLDAIPSPACADISEACLTNAPLLFCVPARYLQFCRPPVRFSGRG